MNNLKKDIPVLLGLIGSTSLAFITSGVASPGLLSLLGNFGINFSSSLLMGLSPERMKRWFVDVHPDDMNHSIKKLFVSSVGEALNNIRILYEGSAASEQDKEEAKKLVKSLQRSLATQLMDKTLICLEEPEVKQFLYNSNDTGNGAIVSFILDALQRTGVSDSFGQFLSQHLAPQIQLCFGEGLKRSENRDAWVAFQRMMAEDLQETVNRIEASQEEIKTELSNLRQGTSGFTKKQMDEIRRLKELLQNPKKFQLAIDKGITESLQLIESKANELIRTTTEIHVTVKELQTMTKRMERKQRQIFIAVCISLAVTAAAAGFIIFYALNQPFTATIHIYGWEGKQHHPLDGKGAVELKLGDKTERAEINSRGEAIFRKLLPAYKNQTVCIALTDTGYEPYYLQDSAVQLRKDGISEVRVMLYGLDQLEGFILDGNKGIAGAKVRVAGISAQTDKQGYFSISIPPEKQRKYQEVEISKDGYKPYRYSEMTMVRQKDSPLRIDLSRCRINN
jgi:hypothetical protein